jgi:ABC-2 type transport system permease protein
MSHVVTIAIREIVTMLRRPSWYVATFIVPLITLGIFAGMNLIGSSFGPQLEGSPIAPMTRPAGYVDQAGVIATLPAEWQRRFIAFEDELAAAAALREDRIDSYFVVAPDYLQSGSVTRVSRQTTIGSATASDSQLFRSLLRINLTGDPALAERLDRPLALDVELANGEAPAPTVGGEDLFTGVSFGLALLLAFAILNGGGWLVQAIAEEKENRTIEILLTSVRPLQIMLGKLLGLGLMSMAQISLWLFFGAGLLGVGRRFGQFDTDVIAPVVWVWALVFFVLGFLFTGGVMLALGAVGASAREAGQISSFMTIPLLVPLWFGAVITEQPDGPLALGFSLFPITAPVTMMLRLGVAPVPLWQILASILLLLLATIGVIWVAARLFRSTTLLTGAKPTPRVLWRALRASS